MSGSRFTQSFIFASFAWLTCCVSVLHAGQPTITRTDGDKPAVLAAANGRAVAQIVATADATPAETTAAKELAAHLEKITGAKFSLVAEKDLAPGAKAIYVGNTAFARSRGIDMAKLGEEDAALKTVDGNLIVAGGRPRGTLYAVYRLLEDILGCRWYAPWAERIPHLPDCSIPSLDVRLSPAFGQRDAYLQFPGTKWTSQEREQWKWFIVRNRVNGSSLGINLWSQVVGPAYAFKAEAAAIGYGNLPAYGGPHTFSLYMGERDFKEHPEWFSERNGKRVMSNGADGNQLCLTNRAMRRVFAERVKENMRKYPDIKVFSVGMNDGGNPTACDCKDCTAFAAKSSWSDLHFDFVNEIADAVKGEFPRTRIVTLAYSYANQPPKVVKAHANVLSYLCLLDTGSVTLPECEGGREFSKPDVGSVGESRTEPVGVGLHAMGTALSLHCPGLFSDGGGISVLPQARHPGDLRRKRTFCPAPLRPGVLRDAAVDHVQAHGGSGPGRLRTRCGTLWTAITAVPGDT